MPKTKQDLRSSLTSQINSAGKREETPASHLDDAGKLTAFTGAAGDVGEATAEAHAATILSGGYAYDLDEVTWIPVDLVHDNPYQPRTAGMGDVGQLQDLIDSMNAHGQEQPVVVRPHKDTKLHPNEFEQVFGHRRKYAIKLGGANAGTGRPDAVNLIGHLPCLIRKGINDDDMLSRAIDENEVREDLITIDRARANRALRLMVSEQMAEEGLIARVKNKTGKSELARLATYREMEERKGKKFRQFARVDAINELPADILKAFDEVGNWGFLKVAHGTALLILQDYPKDQKRLLNDAIKASWSGAETAAVAKERLAEIKSRDSQGTLEGTAEAVARAEQLKRDTDAANQSNRDALAAGKSHLSSVPPVEAQKGPKYAAGDTVKWAGKDRWHTGVVTQVHSDAFGIAVRDHITGDVTRYQAHELVRYNVQTEAPTGEFKAGDRVVWQLESKPGDDLFGALAKRHGDGEGYYYWDVTEERDGSTTYVYETKMTLAPKTEFSSRSVEVSTGDAAHNFAVGDRVSFMSFDPNTGAITVKKTGVIERLPGEDDNGRFSVLDDNPSCDKSLPGARPRLTASKMQLIEQSGPTLVESLAGESHNEALIRKARTFLDAAKNELEQVKDVDDHAREEIELAIDTCRTVMDVLKHLETDSKNFISQL